MEDQILLEAVKEIEDDLVLAEAADLIQRQLAYREQIGGSHTAVKRKNPTPLPVFAASNFVRV